MSGRRTGEIAESRAKISLSLTQIIRRDRSSGRRPRSDCEAIGDIMATREAHSMKFNVDQVAWITMRIVWLGVYEQVQAELIRAPCQNPLWLARYRPIRSQQ